MKYRHAFWGLCLLAFSLTLPTATAQVGIGTTTPNANSILELNGSNKGLLLPRMTTAQRIAFGLTLGAADEGMIVMDTDLNTLLLWNGTSFSSPTRDWRTTGNSNVGIGDYLGTNDNADLSIRTNGTERIGINGTTGALNFSSLAGGGNRVLTVNNLGLVGATTLSGEATTANNGLTLTGVNVALGGNLLGATTLGLGANNLLFNRTTGNVGIGASAPASPLSVGGTGGNFQVSASGAFSAGAGTFAVSTGGSLTSTGITSSGSILFSGLGGGGNRVVGVDNTGLLSGVSAAIMPFGTTTNSTLRWGGANWLENTAFLVNATGSITAATGITSSGVINFSSLGTGLVRSAAGVLAIGTVNAASEISGILPTANGGTGAATGAAGTVFAAPAASIGAGSFRALVAGDIPNLTTAKITSGVFDVSRGGTGTGTLPANGQILIGNGTNYTLAGITAGAGISVTPGSGSITIAAIGGIANGTADHNTLRWNGSSWVESSNIKNTGTSIGIGISGLPTELLSVGGITGNFRVNASGDIISAANISASGAINFSSLGSGVVRSTAGTLGIGGVDLAADVSGTLPVANGGTGASSAAQNAVFVGPVSGGPGAPNFRPLTNSDIPNIDLTKITSGVPISRLLVGNATGTGVNGILMTSGQMLIGQPSGQPIPTSVFGDVTFTAGGTATIQPNAVNATTDITGTLPVGNGGTGLATAPANGQIPIGNGTGYTLAGITGGTGITVTPGAGSISISSSVPDGTNNGQTLRWNGAWIPNNNLSVYNTNVGIATSGIPSQRFGIGGATGNFLVNDAGAIVAATGINSSGPISFSNLGGGGTRLVSVDNSGLLSSITGSALPGNSNTSLLYNDGTNWLATPTTGAGALMYDGSNIGFGQVINATQKFGMNFSAGATSSPAGFVVNLNSSSATSTDARGVVTNVSTSSFSNAIGSFNTVQSDGSGSVIAVSNFVAGTGSGSKIGVSSAVSGNGANFGYDAALNGTVGVTTQTAYNATLTGAPAITSQTGANLSLNTFTNNIPQTGLSLNLSGASTSNKTGAIITVNGATGGTTRGLQVGVAGTGTNYAATFTGGNVGIGTTAPAALLSVGSSSQFQINAAGAIVAATGIISSGATTLSALGGSGTRIVSVDNTGLLSAVTGSILPANSNTSLLYNNGTNWLATPTTGAGQLVYDGANIGFGQPISASQKFGLNYSAGVTSTPVAFIANLSSSSASTTNASGVLTQVFATNASNGIGSYNYVDGGGTGTATAVNNIVAGNGTGAKVGVFSNVSANGSNTGYSATLNGAVGTTTQTGYNADLSGASGISSQTGATLNLNTASNNIPQTGLSLNLSGVSTSNKTGATVTVSGATGGITRGLQVNVAGTGTNYAATFSGGNVGIGTTTPVGFFSVGTSSQFQVDAAGAIAAATGITSSGAITFSGLATGVVKAGALGVLNTGLVNLVTEVTGILPAVNGGLPANNNGSVLYNNGSSWQASSTTGATAFQFSGLAMGLGAPVTTGYKMYVNYATATAQNQRAIGANLTSDATAGISKGIESSISGTANGTIIGVTSTTTSTSGAGTSYGLYTDLSGAGTGNKIGTSIFVAGAGQHIGLEASLTGSSTTTNQVGQSVALATGGNNINQTGQNINLTGTSTSNKTGSSIIISGGSTNTNTGLSIGITGGVNSVNRGLDVSVSGGVNQYAATFTGGNVGIGTTTPGIGFALDVVGAVNASSNITSSNGFFSPLNYATAATLNSSTFATLGGALANALDGNLTTFTTGGVTTAAPGAQGIFDLDLLSERKGILFLDGRISTSAPHNATLRIETSKDNSLFVMSNNESIALTATPRTFGLAVPASCRYVRVTVVSNATASVTLSIAEISFKAYQ